MMVAWYALPLSLRYSATRVAWPMQMGSTPLAAGSSVPACPTRRCLSSLRTFATTSCEVIPVGLLMLSMPSISRYISNHFRNVLETALWYYNKQENRSLADIMMEHTDEFTW